MNAKDLQKVFAMIIAASALGARGLSCGPCEPTVTITPVLPPSSDGGTEDAGDFLADECLRKCRYGACEPTSVTLEDGGTMPAIECTQASECGAGRRPFGLCAAAGGAGRSWLARAAHLEAASVIAFRDLRRDLGALGAPRSLLRKASRAARDEVRHARRMRALARRRGERAPEVLVCPHKPISLEELATQNAVEGCIREAFGALVAAHQALFAEDAEVRAAMARIAVEEAEHAALAYRIDAWARRRLDPKTRERIFFARVEAAREIMQPRRDSAEDPARRALGLPDAATHEALARAFVAALESRPNQCDFRRSPGRTRPSATAATYGGTAPARS